MENLTKTVERNCITIHCSMQYLGSDIQICIWGGERPHIGSVALAEPRPSLTGEGVSATSSVLNRIGHKDEAIARKFAETMAVRENACVCASCGIHIDDATPEQLKTILELSEELLGLL